MHLDNYKDLLKCDKSVTPWPQPHPGSPHSPTLENLFKTQALSPYPQSYLANNVWGAGGGQTQ